MFEWLADRFGKHNSISQATGHYYPDFTEAYLVSSNSPEVRHAILFMDPVRLETTLSLCVDDQLDWVSRSWPKMLSFCHQDVISDEEFYLCSEEIALMIENWTASGKLPARK